MFSYGVHLVEDGSKIRAGGHYFLSDFIKDIDKAQPKRNGNMHMLCKILKNTVASAAECEIASDFENDQDATVIRLKILEMNHLQPPVPV